MNADRTGRARSAPGLRRWRPLSALLTVLVVVLGTLFAAAGSASARSAPPVPSGPPMLSAPSAPGPEFPYPHDGCTLVPEAPSGVSFTTACNHHDGCYGTRQLSRATCDALFHREMIAACDANRGTNYYACRAFASVYYLGVRVFGRYFYDNPDPAVRILTPMRS